jgi:16S rRNA (guanine527-N7)-methyltransferase
VKHLARVAQQITLLAQQAGITVTQEAASYLSAHLLWVLETNRSLNLTAITDVDDGVRLHVVDSLLALPECMDAPPGALIDLGTGAGFPGLPLAVASMRSAVLLDSVTKKMVALQAFLAQNRAPGPVEIEAISLRSEEMALERPESYAVVVARAVSALPVVAELASPLLRSGGRLIALKGRLQPDEVHRGDIASERCGLSRISTRELLLPGGDECRTIVVYEKGGVSQVPLPRRPGIAAKRPLA